MKVKTCPQCGTIFETDNTQKIYCKFSCRDRAKYQKRRATEPSRRTNGYWSLFTQCFDELGTNLATQVYNALRENAMRRYCAFQISPELIATKPDYIDITEDTHEGIHYFIIDRA